MTHTQETSLQEVIVNLPSYELGLYTNNKLAKKFRISIGMGYNGKDQTPICKGVIHEKRKDIRFHNKKGIITTITRTFNEKGEELIYKIPYPQMRGLGVQLHQKGKTLEKYIIHSTTDEFQLETPCSEGCLRLGINDMLNLYDLICPEKETGKLPTPIPLTVNYSTLEIKQNHLLLHADIYGKISSWKDELKKCLKQKGINPTEIEFGKTLSEIIAMQKMLSNNHKALLEKMSRPFPDNYVTQEQISSLHNTTFL